eukprot:SAG31_NODE_18796_length_622_cov_1.089866_1_plen_59_part_10
MFADGWYEVGTLGNPCSSWRGHHEWETCPDGTGFGPSRSPEGLVVEHNTPIRWHSDAVN